MKVLVTGANGLLGHHVVFELLRNRNEVRIIVRNTRNIHFDVKLVTVFEGDFMVYETLKEAAVGCDAIIHIAAVTATDLLHYTDYLKINVVGSAQVIKVADELNIKRLVFVLTPLVLVQKIKRLTRLHQFNFRLPIRFMHKVKWKLNNFL